TNSLTAGSGRRVTAGPCCCRRPRRCATGQEAAGHDGGDRDAERDPRHRHGRIMAAASGRFPRRPKQATWPGIGRWAVKLTCNSTYPMTMACHQEVQFGHLRLVQLLVPLAEPQVDLGAFP